MKNNYLEILKACGLIFIVVFGITLAIGGGWVLARRIIELIS